MSLRNILLGMLSSPASGYDLKRQFNQGLRHFWAAELAQIYPTLQKLEKDGLLAASMEPPAQGPPRKVYRRKGTGSKAVREWLKEGPQFRRDRISYLAQVYFLDELPNAADAKTFMLELRAGIESQLTELRTIEQGWKSDDPRYPDEAFYPHLTLQLGLTRLAATLKWCDESIARMEQRN
ncbi:MAG: PadR family transcriptional regulator [Gammaproteobacteria bacterium]|nr:PadR family transcriptional regulator [Gammaproteobacteria bacterium]MDH3769044.1 PadR family transcriptional regulator [Gammaproteobacteria bacterium]